MGRVFKINAGNIGFIKKKMQKPFHFYLAKKSGFSNFISSSLKEIKLLDEIANYEPVAPDFNPSSTALFTTEYTETKLNKKAVLLFRYKIKKECLWLLELVYHRFHSKLRKQLRNHCIKTGFFTLVKKPVLIYIIARLCVKMQTVLTNLICMK